jgi:Fur family peroxide stress response transcriptional regulator
MHPSSSVENRPFRELCADHGLTATHQRQVLYEVMQKMPGHPSPEEVYARVKKRIPAISLATVYKNIHLFVERGVLKEVSMHHGSLRVELNSHVHHHMVCADSDYLDDKSESRTSGSSSCRKTGLWETSTLEGPVVSENETSRAQRLLRHEKHSGIWSLHRN